MNLRYYLRGLGIGILVTALIMGYSARGHARSMTEDEIRREAAKLGMVDGTAVLSKPDSENLAGEEPDSGEAGAEEPDETAPEEGAAEETPSDNEASDADSEPAQPEEGEAGTQEQEGGADADGDAAEPKSGETVSDKSNQTAESGPDDGDKVQSRIAEADDGKAASEAQLEKSSTEAASEEPVKADGQSRDEASQDGTAAVQDEGAVAESGSNQTVTIAVNRGDGSLAVARKLAGAGLVSSAAEYDEFLCRNGYDKRLRVGSFTIPAGSDEREIAQILTVR